MARLNMDQKEQIHQRLLTPMRELATRVADEFPSSAREIFTNHFPEYGAIVKAMEHSQYRDDWFADASHRGRSFRLTVMMDPTDPRTEEMYKATNVSEKEIIRVMEKLGVTDAKPVSVRMECKEGEWLPAPGASVYSFRMVRHCPMGTEGGVEARLYEQKDGSYPLNEIDYAAIMDWAHTVIVARRDIALMARSATFIKNHCNTPGQIHRLAPAVAEAVLPQRLVNVIAESHVRSPYPPIWKQLEPSDQKALNDGFELLRVNHAVWKLIGSCERSSTTVEAGDI